MENHITKSSPSTPSENWTAEEKFAVVLEAATMSEIKPADFRDAEFEVAYAKSREADAAYAIACDAYAKAKDAYFKAYRKAFLEGER